MAVPQFHTVPQRAAVNNQSNNQTQLAISQVYNRPRSVVVVVDVVVDTFVVVVVVVFICGETVISIFRAFLWENLAKIKLPEHVEMEEMEEEEEEEQKAGRLEKEWE